MPLPSTTSNRPHPALHAGVVHVAAETLRGRPPRNDRTSPHGGPVKNAGAALPVVVVLAVLHGSIAAWAGTPPNPQLRVESNTRGQIAIDARGVTMEEALDALASKAGFEVVLDPGTEQLPVNMAVSMAAVEDVLRQILRGRNYALVYHGDDASPSRVIVLAPPTVRSPNAAYRQRWRPAVRRR